MEHIDLLEKLKNYGYKITAQRKAILDSLISNKNNLISVESILNKTKNIYPKTNITTVYRNLEILEDLKLVHKIITENGISLYQLSCSDEHHHHIICEKCGKTDVIDFCPIKHLVNVTHNKNFTITNHKLELYGICGNCKKYL